jgi:hypothetical protein
MHTCSQVPLADLMAARMERVHALLIIKMLLLLGMHVVPAVPLVPSLSAAAHPASSSFASSTHASFPQARHSGWHTSGIQLSFAASHVSKQDVLPCEGARTVRGAGGPQFAVRSLHHSYALSLSISLSLSLSLL